jgi:2-hydroxy-3-keto-5-methylthiopentenyl-1-phosphate phosphatase
MIQRTGKSDTAVVGWGRGMGHKGHMLLARAVIIQAQNMGADPYFFVSRTVGADDPLYPEEKLYIYKKVFPKHANIFQSATDDIPDINRLMRTLAELGYKNAVLVVGADQVKAFQYLVGQDKAGNIVYKTLGLENLSVIKRQDVDDAAQSEEGPRATPMREILKDPNASDEQKFAVWRDAMPDALSDKEVLALMQKASQRMGQFKPATKKAKIKEFIQRVRPMLKEANAQQKLKVLKLLKESLTEYGRKEDRYTVFNLETRRAILTTGDLDEAEKEAIEWAMEDDIPTCIIDNRTMRSFFEIDGFKGAMDQLESYEDNEDEEQLDEKWSKKYKRSIDCSHPKGFSQKAHCAGRKKNEGVSEAEEPFNLSKRHSMDYGMRKTMIHRLAKATDYDVSDLSLASDEELTDLYKQVFPEQANNTDYIDEK